MTSDTDRAKSTREVLVSELGRLVAPLSRAAEAGPEGVQQFLVEAGLAQSLEGDDAEKLLDQISKTFIQSLRMIRKNLVEEDPDIDDVEPLLAAFEKVFQGIQDLSEVDFDSPGLEEVGDRLIDYLVVDYLHTYHPRWYGILTMTDIATGYETPGPPELDVTEVSTLIENPNDGIRRTLGWGTDESDFALFIVLYYLQDVLWSADVPATFERPSDEDVARARAALSDESANDIQSKLDSEDRAPLYGLDTTDQLLYYPNYQDDVLRIPFLSGPHGSAGIQIVPLPGIGQELPGVAVFPYGVVSWNDEFDLGKDWTASVEASANRDDWGVVVVPKEGSWEPRYDMVTPAGNSISGEVHAEAEIEYDPGDESPEPGSDALTLIGDPSATNLSLQSVSAVVSFHYDGDDVEIRVELPSAGVLEIVPKGGFLKEVLPEDISFDFEATVGWSNLQGVFFGASGKLAVSIPSHASLGPLALREIYLAIEPDESGAIAIQTAASPELVLGPVTATVQRMGVSADVAFPEARDGNMGALDLDVGFQPPDGVGLSIEAGPVTGGGFLEFEPDKHRYSGAFELTIGDYSVKVVGLLKTKLPDGGDGFSLLLLVTGEFPPVQLGFGFALNGIGGLAGVHRDMRAEPLGDAVRTGSLDSVLFPENVVENATQIISDLRSIFPPTRDVYVFGPMAKLSWGTPTLITLDLGVVLSIPTWKIALLGKLRMALPDEETALIDLKLAVVGVLDIPNESVAIDASLYDSRIVAWSVSGDMALRSSWGDEGTFMLSVGGFHPRYSPPESFPELDRVRACLGVPGGNPRLEFTGYVAVTPNTFQVGAGILLHAEAGPASAHGELSFDALFQFDPFKFVVDFFAKLKVAIKGFNLGIEVDGTLSGPKPIRVKGELTIEVAFVATTVHIDVSMGSEPDERELPAARVFPDLREALSRPENWDASRPEGNAAPVSLRDPTADDAEEGGGQADGEAIEGDAPLLIHPLGTVSVRQTVVPLDVGIEAYGNADPRNERFAVTEFSLAGESLPGLETLREDFAPARFREMSDSEKLNSEAFEAMPAGRRFRNDRCYYAGQPDPDDTDAEAAEKWRLVKQATMEYESGVVDEEAQGGRRTDTAESAERSLSPSMTRELARTGAVATGDGRQRGADRYRAHGASPGGHSGGGDRLSVDDDAYVVVEAGSLNHIRMASVDGAENPIEGTTQVEARDALAAYADAENASTDEFRVVGAHEVRSYVVIEVDGAERVDMSGVDAADNPSEGVRASAAREALRVYVDTGEATADELRIAPTHEVGGDGGP